MKRTEVRAPGERGVALVLTLIMLSIIVVVTVVFLATARRNRSSTTVRIDQTIAENAADAAYQHAVGRAVERILRDTNLLSLEFFVSRPNAYGYEVDPNNNNAIIRPLDNDTIPRVINTTNGLVHNPDVFLDLNRNKGFDDPGNATNRPFGDPIWQGILDKPWFPHSRTNRFVARMAYAVLPVGKTLDLNTIHNDTSPNGGDGFMRNQGFGPWELNLAAFLHELDPAIWDYSYTGPSGRPVSAGNAFEDATSFVRYRLDWPANAQTPPNPTFFDVYPESVTSGFPIESIDFYADGYSASGAPGFVLGADISIVDDDFLPTPKATRWPGAETPNHFFNIQELFNADVAYGVSNRTTKVTFEFFERLTNALRRVNAGGLTNSALYYKMISQLGTDTGSDVHDRINVNFADKHARFAGTNFSATNFVAWDAAPELAVAFFTNVAQRIFVAQSNEFNTPTNILIHSVLDIPIAPTNMYSAALHRVFQVSANILDATRSAGFPSVFLPFFRTNNAGNVFISGFEANTNVVDIRRWLAGNVYGITPVVGAKKHLPNFNEFSLVTDFLMSRKLQVVRNLPRDASGSQLIATNQMYAFGISNAFAVEGWNSYKQAYRGNLRLEVTNEITLMLSNANSSANPTFLLVTNQGVRFITNVWAADRFIIPLTNNSVLLPNAVFRTSSQTFIPVTNAVLGLNDIFEPALPPSTPYFLATVTNRITYLLYDDRDRVLDCVILRDGMVVDLNRQATSLLLDSANGAQYGPTRTARNIWATNVAPGSGGVPLGMWNQIAVSRDGNLSTSTDWNDFNVLAQDKAKAIDRFNFFLGFGPANPTNMATEVQTGFNPATRFTVVSSWQANDPLVHYHPADLYVGTNSQLIIPTLKGGVTNVSPATLGYINDRYAPWGGKPVANQATYDVATYDRRTRDAGVYSPDEWRFPSNKLASIGLLGRVHRGTPWQTIYFKPEVASLGDWQKVSSDEARVLVRPATFNLVSRTHPTNDWFLADMFTVGLDERTTRGLLSLNQTNLESWSALLSGVVVLSNNVASPVVADRNFPHFNTYDELFIEPSGGLTNGFFQIWTNIYEYQRTKGRPLDSLGELLQNVPELTVASPFLNTTNAERQYWSVDDFAYEQIPQQILSLLRVGQPRFVIYAYGQALKPQRIDPATGVAVNYQVTAEYATRTVVRIEGDPRSRVRAVVESFNILPPD